MGVTAALCALSSLLDRSFIHRSSSWAHLCGDERSGWAGPHRHHRSASAPAVAGGEKLLCAGLPVCWRRVTVTPHFLLSAAANPAHAGWDVLKRRLCDWLRLLSLSAYSCSSDGRWRQWAGAAKKIIRSFELRLLASLSATMSPEMNDCDNGRTMITGSKSRRAARRIWRPCGRRGEEQQLVVVLTTGGDPGACVRPSEHFSEASVKPSQRQRGAEG